MQVSIEPKNKKSRHIGFAVEPVMWDSLDKKALEYNTTVSDVIRSVVKAWLELEEG